MTTRFWIVLAFTILLSNLSLAREGQKTEYPVAEVVGVRSLSQFECKLKGYPYAESVSFEVQIRDVVLNSRIPAESAMEYVHERLKNAESIVLENIQFRNYFRLIADVNVDGRNLAEELAQQRLALPIELKKEASPPRPNLNRKADAPYRPVSKRPQPTARKVKKRVVTLQQLLETKIDLSMVNEETPLREALEILSESVRPRLPLVVLWNDLESNAIITKDMPVGVGGFGRIKLKKGLEIILHAISKSSQTKLLLALEGQVITLGTQGGILGKSTVRSYSVEDLTSVPSDATEDRNQGNNGGRTRRGSR